MGKLISGKEVSTSIRAKIKEEAQKLRDDYGIQPGLAVILVGNDPASQIYVRNKQKACEEVGFHAFEYRLNENSTQEQLLENCPLYKSMWQAHTGAKNWAVSSAAKEA